MNKIRLEKAARQRVARELMQTIDSSENVSLPTYIHDTVLNIFREQPPPEQKIFKAVGYNDQETIQKIMDLMKKLPKKPEPGQRLKTNKKSTIQKKSTRSATKLLSPDEKQENDKQ